MIFDGFQFSNEFELLKLRCEELKPLKVTHVLVESDTTHSGKPKPLFFEERKSEFSDYRILHIALRMPPTTDPWHREHRQRNEMIAPLNWNDNDTWIITDADEIPRAAAIKDWRGDCARLVMRAHNYHVNRQSHSDWWSGRIVSGAYMRRHSPSQIRNGSTDETVTDAGWHFSWMGGEERMREKLNSIAEVELNRPDFWEQLQCDIDRLPYTKLNGTHPEYLVAHQQEFSKLIRP